MLLIFDLDGTLIDSSRDLAISMNATREHMGLPLLDPALIFSYVGNGAAMLVRRALPEVSEEDFAKGLDFFLKFYRTHAIANTQLYPGIQETVAQLADDGHALAVLTNKPQRISTDILAALQIGDRFRRVLGGDSFAVKKPDPIGIVTLLKETGVAVRDTVMIGDSSVDVQTARNAGVAAWGVSWGFQPESFLSHPPDLLLGTPRELLPAVASHQLVPTSE